MSLEGARIDKQLPRRDLLGKPPTAGTAEGDSNT